MLLKRLLTGKADDTIKQLFRYGIVGGVAFIADFGTLFLFKEYAHVNYLVAAAMSFCIGLMVNYLLSIKWVFNQGKIENKFIEFTVFTIIGLIGLALNELMIWLLTEKLLMHYLLSKIITAFFVYFWNFFARKIILFSKPERQ
jgi:putative flippase GtrA